MPESNYHFRLCHSIPNEHTTHNAWNKIRCFRILFSFCSLSAIQLMFIFLFLMESDASFDVREMKHRISIIFRLHGTKDVLRQENAQLTFETSMPEDVQCASNPSYFVMFN